MEKPCSFKIGSSASIFIIDTALSILPRLSSLKSGFRAFKRLTALSSVLAEEMADDLVQLDGVVEMIAELLSCNRKTIPVAGSEFPHHVVKARMYLLTADHIRYVFDCLKENTTKIRNMKQYLLTALFNAPLTMESHYAAMVNHDLYGGSR